MSGNSLIGEHKDPVGVVDVLDEDDMSVEDFAARMADKTCSTCSSVK